MMLFVSLKESNGEYCFDKVEGIMIIIEYPQQQYEVTKGSEKEGKGRGDLGEDVSIAK